MYGANYEVTCAAAAAGATGATTAADAAVAGMWKKYSMKPAAKMKWAIKMPPIKMIDLLEFCKAGLRMMMSTVPVVSAAPNTSNHCNNEIWMTQNTETGM